MRTSASKFVAVVVGSLLLASIPPTAVQAQAAEVPTPMRAHGALSGDVVGSSTVAPVVPDDLMVAKGQIIRDGRPVAGHVRARVWPDESWLHALPDGTTFDLYELPVVSTDRQGRFGITLPLVLPDLYVGADGRVDVEVIASDGVTATTQSFTASIASNGTGWGGQASADQGVASPEAAGARPMDLTLEVGRSTAQSARERALSVASAQRLSPGDAAATPGVTSADAFLMGEVAAGAVVPAGGGCSTSTGARHGPYMEQYATFYGTPYVKGRVVHEVRTTNTVGVGVKYPGASSWSLGGTQGTSGAFGYDSGYNIANAAVANRVWQRYYYATCYADGATYTTTYTRPDGVADGPYYWQVAHVSYGKCSPTYAGGEYHRTAYANGTFTAGLDLPFINLSAQSGWTTTTEMHWKFSRAGRLCGSNSQLWGVAPRVSADA